MAKISARGAFAVAKFRDGKDGWVFTVRSDGWILAKGPVKGDGWKLYLKFADTTAAMEYARLQGWELYRGYANGRITVRDWGMR